jgi:UDPglucose 6-dehydrogenase
MSVASAEMTKHAINAFLATSVAYTNELARICERVGADASEVERGLRSEPRIGKHGYVHPGPPFAGGTLARDISYLGRIASEQEIATPLIWSVLPSNRLHASWTRERTLELIEGAVNPRVALLGLTYKPGTNTLRRSSAIELSAALAARGATVAAFDPAVSSVPADSSFIQLASSVDEALGGADVAIVVTAWPEFQKISAQQIVSSMRQARVIDQAGFVSHLSKDHRVMYLRVGFPAASIRSTS